MLMLKCMGTSALVLPLLVGCGAVERPARESPSPMNSPSAGGQTATESLGGPLKVAPTGTVTGIFIAVGGPPGARPSPQRGIVTLAYAEGRSSIGVASGRDGRFSIVVPVGTYTVTGKTSQYMINDQEGLCVGGTVTVKRGQTSTVTVGCARR